jgi:exosome complex exonuclease DIS3/RRP44
MIIEADTLVMLGTQELTPDADIVKVRFTKSVIASKAAFTYEEAQIRKDDP